MATTDLEHAIERSHEALASILKGDSSGYKALFSHRDDVTLGNPFGPYARGRKNVEATLDGAASHYRDGEVTGAELIATYATSDLTCVVEVEHGRAKVGGGADLVPVSVRVTSVFRREQGEWRLIHRHADPITKPRPAESVISS
jgi:ketosteroid isomerase-like protein